MTSIAESSVTIQTSPQSIPATPPWFSEVTLLAHYLSRQGMLKSIQDRVRIARRRFGHYDVIDIVDVLIGYAISGERTLEAYYERLQPFANAFMALFGRNRLPARSTLSHFLAALDQVPAEALRTVFLEDLMARLSQAVVRLDGHYGNGAIVTDLAGLGYVMQGKDYSLPDLQEVQAHLALPSNQQTTHPETGTCRALFDCPDLLLTPAGPRTRVIVATHPAPLPLPPSAPHVAR